MHAFSKNIIPKEVELNQVNYRLYRAHESLIEARILAKRESWNGCLDRLFNSCFRIVSALLVEHKINTKSHSRLNTEFRRYYVKTGMVTNEQGALFSNLTHLKYESDFGDLPKIEEENIKPLIPQVKKFLRDIEKLIKE